MEQLWLFRSVDGRWFCGTVITVPYGFVGRRLTVSDYAAARRELLPEKGLLQEGPCLELLSGYAEFYAAGEALAAVTGDMIWELLGDEAAAPGLIAALGLDRATVRMPGPGRPFAMALGGEGACYLGLALD